ncbi:HD family phosphohydrolase [Desulfacinum hydrothermale]|uniref:HD family phosphohydrolase n=1 Tax=Desulfacinum hydrothermale TaxID=109258 RepID=UPI0014822AF9|nr:HDIG domain-containing metalloprotein [Desulfacinum hydrothermale]
MDASKPASTRPTGLEHGKLIVLLTVSALTALLITPSFLARTPTYRPGDVAVRNVKADRDFLLLDEEATARKKEAARREAPLVFDLHERTHETVAVRLSKAFALMRRQIHNAQRALTLGLFPDRWHELMVQGRIGTPAPNPLAALDRESFEKPLGFTVPDQDFSVLAQHRFSRHMEVNLLRWIQEIQQQGILATQSPPEVEEEKRFKLTAGPIVVRRIPSLEEFRVPSIRRFPDLDEARRRLSQRIREEEPDPELARAMISLAAPLLEPTLFYNPLETASLENAAVQAVKPVYIQIKKNEMLIREGQRLRPEDVRKLQAYADSSSKQGGLLAFTGVFLFSCLFLGVLGHLVEARVPSVRLELKDYLFLAAILLIILAVGRCADWINSSLGSGLGYLDTRSFLYALPMAAGAMLCSIFFGITAAVFFSLTLAVFVGLLCGADYHLFAYTLLGSLVGSYGVNPCRNRLVPIKAGLLTGLANVTALVLIALFQENPSTLTLCTNTLLAFLSGIIAGVLATGFTPLAELLCGYTTDIRLLELASMDQPLLQELMIQAPGTYHHSLIVGNMVEAAAKSIGANSLLAKVAGYYHDIGKIKKPLYFIENQLDGENRHEKLAPSMSSLILISHVKEGVELAKKHRLGRPIMEIISQHHGKSLISYFYQKAMETREKAQNSKGADLPPIDIEDYRYPGPKPQTKEAGLVMLADVVEAACRSLSEPTAARIQGLVNRLINNAFIDGQLDECELTLKDLHQIAKHFNQILATVHHKRIEYPAQPGQTTKGKAHGGDSNQRESKQDKDRSAANGTSGRADLKRLGLQ